MKSSATIVLIFSSSIFALFSSPSQSHTPCEPSSCNAALSPKIRFPFWLTNRQPAHCGYQGFDLHCNDQNETIITLPQSGEFVVNHIDYMVQAVFINDTDSCLPGRILNFTLEGSPFWGNMWNYSFLNCSSDSVDYTRTHYMPLSCMSGRNYTVMAPVSADADSVLPMCRRIATVLLPSLQREYLELFWREPSCWSCENQGGVCWYKGDVGSQIGCFRSDNNHRIKLTIIVLVMAGFVCIPIPILVFWCWTAKKKGIMKRRINQKTSEAKPTLSTDSTAIVLRDELEKVNIDELPLFTFGALANATNYFHNDNMLGKGGFGSVYLGKLENGREIAIKRLSEASAQGVKEFMNEVIVISRVQHRNLVGLIGCCVEREEKMLIYEYMPNKSLDVSLFVVGHPSQKFLDWKKRFSIIEGIGRGLLYLHKHSRLRIIHRDLKPSNVLLDCDWNPKISDFGMARIFGGNEDQANTARVVGTYGYMAPEYAMEGRFSEKSDVYSFGVLLLEIVSGKKNKHYYNGEWSLSLLGCAWKLWNKNNGMAFVDQRITSSNIQEEIVRCIHIALLCVQESPVDRPIIQTVLSMLNTEIKDLPLPEQPVFAEKWNCSHVESTQCISQIEHSINELTVTVLDGR